MGLMRNFSAETFDAVNWCINRIMENSTASKIIIGSFLTLLGLCLVWAIVAQQSKLSLQKRVNEEELKSEALLSEKLSVQKAFDQSKSDHEKLKTELDAIIEQKSKSLTTQTQQNKQIEKSLRLTQEKLKAETATTNRLKAELDSQNISYTSLNTAMTNLSDSISFFKDQNAYLKSELDDAIMRSIDQTLVSGVKKNKSKVTSKARAAKKLIANVEVPASLTDLSFTLEGPNGEIVSDANGSIVSRVLPSSENAVASANQEEYHGNTAQLIEISYVPTAKLKAGTYTFKIFNDEKYIGSMMVQLR